MPGARSRSRSPASRPTPREGGNPHRRRQTPGPKGDRHLVEGTASPYLQEVDGNPADTPKGRDDPSGSRPLLARPANSERRGWHWPPRRSVVCGRPSQTTPHAPLETPGSGRTKDRAAPGSWAQPDPHSGFRRTAHSRTPADGPGRPPTTSYVRPLSPQPSPTRGDSARPALPTAPTAQATTISRGPAPTSRARGLRSTAFDRTPSAVQLAPRESPAFGTTRTPTSLTRGRPA
jgi:hypothetical protein